MKANFEFFTKFLGSIHFLEEGWAGGIQGRVMNFLLAQKGRVSINEVGHYKLYCFLGEGHIF